MAYDANGNYLPDFLHSHVSSVPRADLPATRNRAIATRDEGKAWQGMGGVWQEVNDSLSLMPEHLTHFIRKPPGGATSGPPPMHPVGASEPSSTAGLGHSDYMAQERRRYRQAVQEVRVVGANAQHERPTIPTDDFLLRHSKRAAAASAAASPVRAQLKVGHHLAGAADAPTRPGDWERVAAPGRLDRLTRCLEQCLRDLNGLHGRPLEPSATSYGLFAPPPRAATPVRRPGWGMSHTAGPDSFLNAHVRTVSNYPRDEANQPYERRELMSGGGCDADSYMMRHIQKVSTQLSHRVKPFESRVADMPPEMRQQQKFELFLKEDAVKELEEKLEASLQA